LVYDAKIVDSRTDGGLVECTARVGERPVADAEFVFACLPGSESKTICQQNFMQTMQLLGGWEAGAGKGQGAPVRPGDAKID
jgi:hypothetical protein